MKVSIRIAEQLKGRLNRRGLIADIEKHTGIERHTVSGLLNNTVKYVSIEALAKISDYLIHVHGADASTLPGALIGRDPEHFWDMLAGCEQLDFCLGTRTSEEWEGADYVMSTDSRLQGVLLSKVARFENEWEAATPTADDPRAPSRRHHFPEFHLVPAPGRTVTAEDPGSEWPDVRAQAEQLYADLDGDGPQAAPGAEAKDKQRQGRALIALGSPKVNPMVELMLASTFRATAFSSEDQVAQPGDRHCPILFRYRDTDPQPPCCCGGLRLAADTEAPQAGLYYETDDGTWKCYPGEMKSSDAAFVFYTFRPNIADVQVACGGFSSRATHCLTQDLEQIVPKLGEPQFVSDRIHVGLYVICFSFDPSDSNYGPFKDNRPFEHEVIPVSSRAIERRLKHWL